MPKTLLSATVKYTAAENHKKWGLSDYGSAKITLDIPGVNKAHAYAKPEEEEYWLKKGAQVQVAHDKGAIYKVMGYDDLALEEPSNTEPSPSPETSQSVSVSAPVSVSGPLDVVGLERRELTMKRELDMRLQMMNMAVQAATKSLAMATGNWDEATKKPLDSSLLEQEAIHGLATSVMIGLFDQRSYFAGVNLSGGGER